LEVFNDAEYQPISQLLMPDNKISKGH